MFHALVGTTGVIRSGTRRIPARVRSVGAARIDGTLLVTVASSASMEPIDWAELRRAVRLQHGRDLDDESFGTEEARLALCHLLGDDALRAAVDYYVDWQPAREMARCALMILRPKAAVERCLEIYRSDPDPERRLWAAEALSWTADGDSLPVVEELLADPEPAIQRSGAYLLDQLLWTGLAHPHLAEPLLLLAEEHANADVRATASNIWEYLERRGVQRSPTEPDDPTVRCAICGEELGGSAVVRWASVPGLAWHLSCEATAGGQAWFERLRKEHPALDRQVKLRSLVLDQDCSNCGAHHSVSPTATGLDPSGWSVNCCAAGRSGSTPSMQIDNPISSLN